MRMKNRFSKMKTSLLSAVCLLSTCGITYSCSDDYDLDETMPSFLGGSIYDELKARNFTTVVRLIDDLEYADVLSRTGSKTLFVAPDSAFDKFFATTTWTDIKGQPVRSYEQLTSAQKKLLLYNTMLNNADVLEMLPYSQGGGRLTMRRGTAASAVDTVKFWRADELPDNKNIPVEENGSTTGDTRFWDAYRKPEGGLYMALDATNPMMLHFIEDQMKERDITHEDVSFILGLKGKDEWKDGAEGGKRTYVYDAQIIEQDVTCLNGYFNVLDKVVITPPNMAEIIRTNGSTNLFSQMLDRFSAPYYSASLTDQYRALHDIGNDSVFAKRYISSRSAVGSITMTPDNKSLGDFPVLNFDPGWNEYTSNSAMPAEQDMAAMFVPSDAAMEAYFLTGAGRAMLDRFATEKPVTKENLSLNLYQIPLNIVRALINNLMKESFIETVPSKYYTIKNDAQDAMFPMSDNNYKDLAAYKTNNFEKCLLANNGVVYVMNKVISPADYASVIAPALYSTNTQITNAVIRADDNFVQQNPGNAPLKKYFSTYLKAMQAHFTFFVPTDEGLGLYGLIDPMSFARNVTRNHRYWRLTYENTANARLPIRAVAYRFDYTKDPAPDDKPLGTSGSYVSAPNESLTSGTGKIKRQLLVDMIDQHIIVHDENDPSDLEGLLGDRTYYISRSGAPVYLRRRASGTESMVVDGGFQLQVRQDADKYPSIPECKVVDTHNMTAALNGYGNGYTYFLDRPMQATTKSVYNILSGDADHYSEFFSLCNNTDFTEEVLTKVGFIDEKMEANKKTAELKKYRIFTNAGVHPAQNEKLVRFFSNYRYTIYAPTNAAIQDAYSKGLMNIDDIEEFVYSNLDADGNLSEENKQKAQAMITMLVNFVKYHFQDQMFFVDNVNNEGKYQTSCIDNIGNVYLSIRMKQSPGAMTLTDNDNQVVNVVEPYNMMARDADFDSNVTATATGIDGSSYVAIHQVDKVLNFFNLNGGRYDAEWATPASAKKFVTKYRIRK